MESANGNPGRPLFFSYSSKFEDEDEEKDEDEDEEKDEDDLNRGVLRALCLSLESGFGAAITFAFSIFAYNLLEPDRAGC